MKWRLSNETGELIHGLWQADKQRSWFGMRKQCTLISSLLRQIAERDEIGAIAAMPHFLLSDSPEIRVTAGQAIAHLLSVVPSEELLSLDDVSDWSWSWTVGDKKIQPATVRPLVADMDTRTPVLGLISFHRNGYVRHEAVRLLADIHDGSELPYLLVRHNDWVEPISKDAYVAVQERLVDEYLAHFVRNMPLVVRLLALRRRDHSGLVHRIVEMLVQPGHEELLTAALRLSDRTVKRRIVKLALDIPGEHQVRIVRLGVISDDPVLRTWCCRLVRCVLSDDETQEILKRLQQDQFHPVRSAAYQVAAEYTPDDETGIWESALLDSGFSIRELARWHLAKLGVTDVTAVYRDALTHNPNSLSALLGLGETGGKSDLPLVRTYLKSSLPSRRRAAVRGVAHIGGDDSTDELVECIKDDSPSIAREVRRQIEELGAVLNGESLLAIVINDSRLHCRKEAIRLMFSMSKWRSLPWLIRSAGHSDPETAAFARSFIEAWFSPPLCNNVWTTPSGDEREAIRVALSQSQVSIALPTHFLDGH